MLGLHDTTHNPIGLWQFDETLVDSSGNGFNFSLAAGTQRFTEIYPGVRALQLLTTNRYTFSTTGTVLQRTGDITIEMLLLLQAIPAGSAFLAYDAVGETLATNTLYNIGIASESLIALSESGAGVDASHSPNRLPPLGELCHLAWRRAADVGQFFVNGKPFGASAAVTTPAGGTSSFLSLGGAAGTTPLCALASLKIVPSALTDDQIDEEAEKTVGGVFGTRTLRDVLVDGVAKRTGWLAQYPFEVIEQACNEERADIDRTLVVFK